MSESSMFAAFAAKCKLSVSTMSFPYIK
jgi:hypothetical protein